MIFIYLGFFLFVTFPRMCIANAVKIIETRKLCHYYYYYYKYVVVVVCFIIKVDQQNEVSLKELKRDLCIYIYIERERAINAKQEMRMCAILYI